MNAGLEVSLAAACDAGIAANANRERMRARNRIYTPDIGQDDIDNR
jgi:hypothetical protein